MKLTIYLACSVITAALLFAAICAVTPQAEYAPQDEQAQADEEISPSPIVGFLKLAGSCLRENGSIITVIATVVIAIFTIVLAHVSRRQAELTREAMIMDRRAFVFVVGIQAQHEIDENTLQYYWRFRPKLRNSGQTPTKHMITETKCYLVDEPLRKGFTTKESYRGTFSVLVPPQTVVLGQQAPPRKSVPISPLDLEAVQNGTKYLYLGGNIRYYDIFPDTPDRVTRFCLRINCVGNAAVGYPSKPDVSFDFIYHDEGNCADDGCPKYKSEEFSEK